MIYSLLDLVELTHENNEIISDEETRFLIEIIVQIAYIVYQYIFSRSTNGHAHGLLI